MRNILDIISLDDIIASVVEAMLWEDDAEHMSCRDNDFPVL